MARSSSVRAPDANGSGRHDTWEQRTGLGRRHSVRAREHLYLALMVGTPLLAAVVLGRSPGGAASACEAPAAAPKLQSVVAAAPAAVPCIDGLSEPRRAATPGRGAPIELRGAAPLDASWTRFVTASVDAIVGNGAVVRTAVTPLPERRALIVATTTDALGRPVSAFTISVADAAHKQRAHRICGYRPIAAYAVSADVVEVQLDDGSAVWATPERILPFAG